MTKDSEEQITSDREPGSAGDPGKFYPERVQGSRFFSCLLIAAVFIIIDLAIMLYFLWPESGDKFILRMETAKPVVEQQVPVKAPPAADADKAGE